MMDDEIRRAFSVPTPQVGALVRRVPDAHAEIRRLRELGYFGVEGELDRRALARAYGVSDG